MERITVGVVGLGLIGASIAACLKEGGFAETILGHDLNKDVTAYAQEKKYIDQGVTLAACARNSDLAIIAVPVCKIPLVTKQMMPYLKPGTILTDTGSTKAWVDRQIRHLIRNDVLYIGGHPMAGSEKAGIFAAKADLFHNAPYFLTPTATDNGGLSLLKRMVRALGAKPYLVAAETHDKIVAQISHLPYLVATALILSFGKEPHTSAYAAGGFRDTTRVASSDPVMAGDFCLTNRSALIESAKVFIDQIQQLIDLLDKEEAIKERLKEAKDIRAGIASKKGWER